MSEKDKRARRPDERSGRSKSRSKKTHNEEASFQGSDLRKKKKKKAPNEGKSISRVDSLASLNDPEIQNVIKNPGDNPIITPQEVGITSSKHNSEKRAKSNKESNHEERKSHRKQPSQKSRNQSEKGSFKGSNMDDIPDSENKIELYKFDFKSALKPEGAEDDPYGEEEPEEEGDAQSALSEQKPVINTKELVFQLQKKNQLMQQYQLAETKKDKIDGSYVNDFTKIDTKTVYFSRRNLTYDDDKSQDSNEEELTVLDLLDKPKKKKKQKIDAQNEGNTRFSNFKEVFENLTVSKTIDTLDEILSITVSTDGTQAIVITMRDDQEYFVLMYDLRSDTHEMTFSERVGGKPESFIKFKEVQQNQEGSKYAIAYIDDGNWRLRIFGKEQRTSEAKIDAGEFDINKEFGIDNYTIPFEGFSDPLIVCCFVGPDKLFVSFFHNYHILHHHFMFDLKDMCVIGKKVEVKMDTNQKNFPYSCFYNDEKNEIYLFYRQGEAFTINPEDPSEYSLNKITDQDLGQMFLYKNSVMIVRSSSKILFFKMNKEEDPLIKKVNEVWRIYHTIYERGSIFTIQGNNKIQITTMDKIYYYRMEPKTFEPVFENCLYNFMDCTQCIFGSDETYCITFKQNETVFQVFRQKYKHEIRVPASKFNFEGSRGVDIGSNNQLCVSNINELRFYNANSFQLEGSIPINMLESVTREVNEVIGLQKCQNEQYIAVISGKNLIMNEQKASQVFIFIRDQVSWSNTDRFFFYKRVVINDIKEFDGISMDFHFKQSQSFFRDSLIFARKERIFIFDYVTMRIRTLYKFQVPLKTQPQYFIMNDSQTTFVICSPQDGIFFNIATEEEVDLDELYNIGSIKQIAYDAEDHQFYLLANKFQGKLGLFLIVFNEQNPKQYHMHIKIKNLLDIDDCYLAIQRNKNQFTGLSYKELVVAYKTININTFDLFVYDISGDRSERATLFRHESFQLWESQIRGVLMEKSKDFITLSNNGIGVMALGSKDRKQLQDSNGQDWLLHNLEGFNFLKVDRLNYVVYRSMQDSLDIKIDQEYMKVDHNSSEDFDEQTTYVDVYKLKVLTPTIRDLMIFKSLFICKSLTDIVTLVESQPNPAIFYNSYLELDGNNLSSILSFDSRSMRFLLSETHSSHFSHDYPIIYKNKHKKKSKISSAQPKYFYRSAIDNALLSNQVGSVQTICNYVAKYQNNFVSHYLFLKNFTVLLQNQLDLAPMLEGNIFQFDFDFEEWPIIHDDEEECIRPYNDSLFQLSQKYEQIFPEERFQPLPIYTEGYEGDRDFTNVQKIRYSINLLPMIGEYIVEKRIPSLKKSYNIKKSLPDTIVKENYNKDVDMMGVLTKINQYELFDAPAMVTLIEYKWDVYGRKLHGWGLFFHMIYMSTIIMYNYFVYVNNQGETRKEQLMYVALIGQGCLYPAIYNIIQIQLVGARNYFSNSKNIPSIMFNFTSILTLPSQIVLGPFHFCSKILNTVTILLAVNRTFNFLRIYDGLSPIVTMIKNVVLDLKIFITIYFILSLGFSLTFCVLGMGNLKMPGAFQDKYLNMSLGLEEEEYGDEEEGYGDGYDDEYRLLYGDEYRLLQEEQYERRQMNAFYRVLKGGKGGGGEYPGAAYKYIGMFVGTFITTIRTSMADFEIIKLSPYLNPVQNVIFWCLWLLVVVLNTMIFLNFIIAEASASYQKVVDNIDAMISKQKAEMIQETENMTFQRYKTLKKMPRYIIVRKLSN